MRSSTLSALAASLSTASAIYQGFNYGSTYSDGSTIVQSEFEALFNAAKGLVGHADAFTSARLYTMIQAGTSDGVIEAIPAAINTDTTLLLGLWASAGQADFDNELAALKSAISTYGTDFTDLIAGISVGSEDLYRISPTGILNKSGVGANPDVLVSYINQVKSLIAGTAASSALIGHVDTWTAWVNGSNDAVIAACDFLGMDAYPYFQTTIDNGIDVGNLTFFEAYDNTVGAAEGKPVWITETGWPVSGPTENLAVASLANAKTYWDEVACTVLGNINTWWYTIQDSYPDLTSPSFGIVNSTLSTTPQYDLTCPGKSSSSVSSSTTSASASTSATEAIFSATSASLISTDTSLVGTASATAVAITSAASGPETAMTSEIAASATQSSASTEASITTGAPVTTAAVTTIVDYSTDVFTITSCSDGCTEQAVTVTTEQTFYATATEASATVTSVQASATEASATNAASTAAQATSSATATGTCTTDILSGSYEYPHLIVPVSSVQPTTALGTSYFGEFSSTVSSIFNFDIPASDAGKTCTLVFLFPTQAELETSSFTTSGTGGLEFKELSSPASVATTYDTIPSAAGIDVTLSSVTPGNSYVVVSHECGAGERISFEVSATGSLDLKYFQDYNPSPIGLYVSVC